MSSSSSSSSSSHLFLFPFAALSLAAAGTGLQAGSENCTAPASEAEDLSLLQALRRGHDAIKPLVIPGLGSLVGNKVPGGSMEYLNISYAVRPGRFQAAELNTSWHSVLDATKYGHSCIQATGRELSEDCLNLNVWTPQGKPSSPLPVWFWIYGGGLISGSGSLYNGSELSSKYKLVVVTINYRLGALGWLAVGDNKSSGAMNGWHDTLVALRWVKSYIAAFGGDPEKIYIGGESGGSLLTCQHLFSPLTAAVGIAGVTLESGSCVGPWGPNTMRSSFTQSLDWMKYALGGGSRPRLVKKAKEAHSKLYRKKVAYGNSCCGPSAVDGKFFTKLPVDSKFAVPPRVRVLLGSNSIDGIATFSDHHPVSKEALIDLLRRQGLRANATDVVKFYTQTPGLGRIEDPDVGKWTLLFWQIHRDASNTCPTLLLAERLSEYGASDVYLYWEDFARDKKDFHGSELSLFWGSGYTGGPPFNVNTVMGTQDMLRNFLYGAEPATSWKSFAENPKQQNYLKLSKNPVPQSGYERTACAFWRKFYDGPLKLREQFFRFGWKR
mmetsp:Transcript_98567/g.287567  ORF Transcript_98567/g.287567 Transcript_98567/m.287567 type:complete len:552 (+) Transcript_98567:155-1810(+)